ncbi:MAG: hypothetical protein JST86_04395 [Bacteroidetes bacterium]|nr:hypothetical protein [Bacteroidota bacterium]
MSYTDKHIIESYTSLMDGLSPINKQGLLDSLSKSLKAKSKSKDDSFYKSFGAFASGKSAAAIFKAIKKNRKFKAKAIKF